MGGICVNVVIKVCAVFTELVIIRMLAQLQINRLGLIVFIQITELFVNDTTAVHGEEREIVDKILDLQILKHGKLKRVVGSCLVRLGHFYLSVIHLDLTVVGKITHVDIHVNGAGGGDIRCLRFGAVELTV